MMTQREVALQRAEELETIPRMTHPLSKYWDQPGRSNIMFVGDKAVMNQTAFRKLKNYSASVPTGAYEGKMWKRGEPYVKPTRWFLCWYGKHADPDKVSINYREIEILDFPRPETPVRAETDERTE